MKADTVSNVPATLALALGLWSALVAAGTRAGVFARLPVEAYAALAAFAIVFALGAVTLDREVRAWLERPAARSLRLFVVVLATLAVTIAVGFAGNADAVGPATGPWAPILLLGVPASLAMALARGRARLGRPAAELRSPASTAPLPRQALPSASHTSARSAASVPARSAG